MLPDAQTAHAGRQAASSAVVRNAARCTDAGTAVDISLTAESIGDHRVAVIKVRDHGQGVPEGSIKEIFRPFYRVEDDRDRRTGGAGLGLSIAERAVRLHHGTINASNATDGGLIVEIRLPIDQAFLTFLPINPHCAATTRLIADRKVQPAAPNVDIVWTA
jgi:K+-sensing histidine kinase KdpD